jgi:hypothetical protein
MERGLRPKSPEAQHQSSSSKIIVSRTQGSIMAASELLGHVKVKSGRVLVIDMGLLNLWSHDKPPHLPDGVLPPNALEQANQARDFAIEGPDAEKAGIAFAKQPNPGYLYDIVPARFEEVTTLFNEMAAQRGLKASLRMLPHRVTHADRIDQALTYNSGSGVVFFNGIDAIVINNIPVGVDLPVYGNRMAEGEYATHWRNIFLQVRPAEQIDKTTRIGTVSVDRGRLMFVDPLALAHWQHEQPIDGKADFVFWGKDAASVATTFNAGHLPEGAYGWMNQPVEQTVEMGLAVEDYRQNSNLKFATDFRPHSHHYELMKQIRAAETESGTLQLDHTLTCAFMTSWGDGFFPVLTDLNAAGDTVRIRIELGTDETIKRMQSLS